MSSLTSTTASCNTAEKTVSDPAWEQPRVQASSQENKHTLCYLQPLFHE